MCNNRKRKIEVFERQGLSNLKCNEFVSVMMGIGLSEVEHYRGDLSVDARIVFDAEDNRKFGTWSWFIRKCGTHLTSDTDFAQSVRCSLADEILAEYEIKHYKGGVWKDESMWSIERVV